jgi:uncharacterized membrane protein
VIDSEVVEVEEVAPPRNRMAITFLALVGVFISLYLTLHKMGLIGTLLCGTGSCDLVQASKYALFLGMPVPYLGLAGYIVLTAVGLASLQPNNINSRPITLALILFALGAFGFSVYLSLLEQFVIHAWCRWCIASAIIATLIFLFSLPEYRRLRRTA